MLGCLNLRVKALQLKNSLKNKESVQFKKKCQHHERQKTEDLSPLQGNLGDKKTNGVILDWFLDQEKDTSESTGKI